MGAMETSRNEVILSVNDLVTAFDTEAGLIHAVNCSTGTQFCWIPTSMTWQGHEFLDAAATTRSGTRPNRKP